MPKGRKKDPMARETFIYLWSWLMGNCFSHMLEWSNMQNREFSILFMNKRNREWTEKYLDLFKALDNISPKKAARYQLSADYDKDCKKRCKSNLQKLCKDKILKQLGVEEIKESIKRYHYRFLEVPSSYLEKKNVQLNRTKCRTEEIREEVFYKEELSHYLCLSSLVMNFNELEIKRDFFQGDTFQVKNYDPQVEKSIKTEHLLEGSCHSERKDNTNSTNYNFSAVMGKGRSNLSSFGMTLDENLLHEVEESICLNPRKSTSDSKYLSTPLPRKVVASLKPAVAVQTPKLESTLKGILKNYNFIQPVENNISSSDTWLEESLLSEAEDSFSLNNIPNYPDVQTTNWNEYSELMKYDIEEEIPSSNDVAVRQNHHLIKDEDPFWSTECNQMEPLYQVFFEGWKNL